MMVRSQHKFFDRLAIFYVMLIGLVAWPDLGRSQVVGVADSVNQFPVIITSEAFRGSPSRVTVRFNIYFPVDEQRYVPVKEMLVELLSVDPDVSAATGLNVRVLKTLCAPQDLSVQLGQGIALVKGGHVETELEIIPTRTAKEGEHIAILSYPLIDLAFEKLNARAPRAKAQVYVRVRVWSSLEAKLAMQRRVEEDQRRQEEARLTTQRQDAEKKRQAEEARRQQALAEEQARREARWQFLLKLSPVIPIFLLVGLIVFVNRKWIWPDIKVTATAGEHKQLHRAKRLHSGEQNSEPGTIIRTMWAKNWRKKLQRIKVETFVTADIPDEESLTGIKRFFYSPPGIHAQSALPQPGHLDLLVSVGDSVAPGRYLVKSPDGAVLIKVTG